MVATSRGNFRGKRHEERGDITAIWTAYSLEDYLPSDRHLFQTSCDHILQHYDKEQLKQWLASIEAAQERFTSVSTHPPTDPVLEAQRASF